MAVALMSGAFLAACGGEPAPAPEETAVPDVIADGSGKAAAAAIAKGAALPGTPMKDRVITLGLLNKRNNLTQDLVMKPGEARRIGNVVVKVAACERSLPWEKPQEEGAFVQVFVEERASSDEKVSWHKVFSGWLFKNSPALNFVQHPVYDVWVKKCAMSFPGQDSSPADRASSNKASKPAGIVETPASSEPAEEDAPTVSGPAASLPSTSAPSAEGNPAGTDD